MFAAQDFHGHDAKKPGVYNTGMSSEDEVRRVETEWGEAFERKDLVTLDRLMADDYILTDPLGNVRSKAENAIRSLEMTRRESGIRDMDQHRVGL